MAASMRMLQLIHVSLSAVRVRNVLIDKSTDMGHYQTESNPAYTFVLEDTVEDLTAGAAGEYWCKAGTAASSSGTSSDGSSTSVLILRGTLLVVSWTVLVHHGVVGLGISFQSYCPMNLTYRRRLLLTVHQHERSGKQSKTYEKSYPGVPAG